VQISVARLAVVILPLAAVEGVVYPLLLHDSATWWLSYSVYLALGVILPGTLVAQAFVRWRADWLTWIGIGWALGHVLEVVAIQLAKCVGLPRLFLIWIPIAYLITWRKGHWRGEVAPVGHPVRCAVMLAALLAFASTTFVMLNLLELSPRPPYQSDVLFHINEASEFRNHLDTGDPRLAGEPYAYHTLEYGPAVGANLATQVPIANLITRYSGLSLVWLLVLLLFNSARHIRSPIAGFLSSALIVAPLDLFSLVSSKLSFGSSIIYSGLDLSTSTLVGFCALAALFLPVRAFLMGGQRRDLWVVGALAYMASGSKSVPGPLLVVAAVAIIGGGVLQLHRPSLRPVLLLAVFVATFCATALPILLRPTIADSVTIAFASVARLNPYAHQLTRLPSWLRLGFYPVGLNAALWIGASFGAWRLTREGESNLVWFVLSALVIAAVLVDATSLAGSSELFFLYMAMVLVAPVAGIGLCELGRLTWQGRKGAAPITAAVLVCALVAVHVKVGGTPSPPFADGSYWTTALEKRVESGVRAYRDPGPSSRPTPITYTSVGRILRLTPAITAGLAWLRSEADASTVIATNVPGAAMYAALCECREYFQTEEYAPGVNGAVISAAYAEIFAQRGELLRMWLSGQPGGIDALRRVGINYVIVDHVNGVNVSGDGLGSPVFSNADVAIYRL